MKDLMPAVYSELHRIAHRQLRRQPRGHTLNTTAVVHEAFLKLSDGASPDFNDRAHFFAVSANAMRNILVDYARRRGAQKRGGDRVAVTLEDGDVRVEDQRELLIGLDEAMTRLSELNPRLTQVVECRFFGGMTEEETAAALGVTSRTVRRDWTKARAWLHRELESIEP